MMMMVVMMKMVMMMFQQCTKTQMLLFLGLSQRKKVKIP